MATPTTLPASFVSGAVLTASQMNNLRGAFRVLQVVQTIKTDTFNTTSTTYVDVTGLSVTITPSSTSSKILVIAFVPFSSSGNGNSAYFQLAGGNAGTFVGDAAGNRIRTSFYTRNIDASLQFNQGAVAATAIYLDSPNTTSATTYKVQARTGTSVTAGTAAVNYSVLETNDAGFGRAASSITVMEISA